MNKSTYNSTTNFVACSYFWANRHKLKTAASLYDQVLYKLQNNTLDSGDCDLKLSLTNDISIEVNNNTFNIWIIVDINKGF
jgi:hypothetical protein